ncbi:hypothetical protein [Achromobacter phage ewik_TL4]|nr:hypothetical protein [Achromobacter phage ewik_TL4]
MRISCAWHRLWRRSVMSSAAKPSSSPLVTVAKSSTRLSAASTTRPTATVWRPTSSVRLMALRTRFARLSRNRA